MDATPRWQGGDEFTAFVLLRRTICMRVPCAGERCHMHLLDPIIRPSRILKQYGGRNPHGEALGLSQV